MSNTTVTIKFADGTKRTLAATDQMEERILTGDMFNVATSHPDSGVDIDKMYSGNPMAALGRMLMLHHQLNTSDPEKARVVETCISYMATELGLVQPETVH